MRLNAKDERQADDDAWITDDEDEEHQAYYQPGQALSVYKNVYINPLNRGFDCNLQAYCMNLNGKKYVLMLESTAFSLNSISLGSRKESLVAKEPRAWN